MIRRLIEWRIATVERTLGVPADYLRHMMRVSVPAFMKFAKILPLASYRRKLPAEAAHVGQLVAMLHEDCGTCVQIGVNLAKRDHVRTEWLRAVLEARPDDLPPELADVYRFAKEVVKASGEEDSYRERIRAHYGEEALIELAMAIASCRVFPTTKRAMGFAKSCSAVRVTV
jgi:alkylhydroperoxidase family enzyme